jgi:hypothetical protein
LEIISWFVGSVVEEEKSGKGRWEGPEKQFGVVMMSV